MTLIKIILVLAVSNIALAGSGSIKVKKAGDGTGRVFSTPAGFDCDSKCPEQELGWLQNHIQLQAKADPDSKFKGWSGKGCSGTSPCKLKGEYIEADLTATFVKIPKKK